jgi:hypothetical protein
MLAIYSTIMLAIISIACLAHIKVMPPGASWCSRVGFALVFAGSAGAAAEFWWPQLEHYLGDQVLYTGMAFLALATLRGDVRLLLDRMKAHWDGRERRFRRGDRFAVSAHPLDDH